MRNSDAARSGKTGVERELAEVRVTGEGHPLLALSPREDDVVGFSPEIFLGPQNVVADFTQLAYYWPRNVFVRKEAHVRGANA